MQSETVENPENQVSVENEPPIVFISYSQKCDNKDKVLQLAASLRINGCDVRIDVVKTSPEDWIQWMERQLEDADFVLCMVSQSYAQRFRRDVNLDEGHGVAWEAGLIARKLYSNKWQNSRFLPCFFSRSDRKYIPDMLTGYDEYLLDSEAGLEKLLRRIFNKPSIRLPDRGEPPALETTTPKPLFDPVKSEIIDHSDSETAIESRLLDALLSRINRDEQKDALMKYLLEEGDGQKMSEVGAYCIITGADADDCLNLFALTCLECVADSEDTHADEDLLQMLRSCVVQSMRHSSLAGDSRRVGLKFQKEIDCVDPTQWAVFHCHVDKASKAVKIADHFLTWRKQKYGADGRKVLLVLFTDKIGQGRTVPSLARVVASPALIEAQHVKQWRTYIEGRPFLSKAQKQVLSNALGKLKDEGVRLLTIQDKLRNSLKSI